MRTCALLLCLTAFGCASSSPCDAGDSILNATLWVRSAAEYRASALQTYATARRALDEALAEPSSQPAAIVLDLDETALDNAEYAVQSIQRNETFAFDDDWTQWVAQSASSAVPGAAEFVRYAASRGVTPFYITNRVASMEAATRVNLQKLGFPLPADQDTLLVRGEREDWNTTDKTTRRNFVAAQYRVLLYLGDDLNDFTSASGKSVAERAAIVDNAASLWGKQWIIVPNPIYGSWESATTNGTGTPCEQLF